MSPLRKASSLKRRRALRGKWMLMRGMKAIIWLVFTKTQSDSKLVCLG